jgi:hypothetical protein
MLQTVCAHGVDCAAVAQQRQVSMRGVMSAQRKRAIIPLAKTVHPAC